MNESEFQKEVKARALNESYRKAAKGEELKIAVELPPPTGAEIDEVIERIYERLDDPAMKEAANWNIFKGYQAAIEILAEEITDHSKIPKELLDGLHTTQSRAIVQAAIEFLGGTMTREFLINIPIKNGRPTENKLPEQSDY